MKIIKKVSLLLLTSLLFAACSGGGAPAADTGGTSGAGGTAPAATAPAQKSETVTLKAFAALTPHKELLDFVAPKLEAQGIKVDVIGTAEDGIWNQKVYDGEADFNYFQHIQYLNEYNAANGIDLVNAGSIHVEPIAAYSEKYSKVEDVPDGAVVAIPNDPSNEFRALTILQTAGFIKLKDGVNNSNASKASIAENTRNIDIIELDSAQILPTASDYDVYVVNTNRAIEAGIDFTNYLFREGSDSPYANIIAVKKERFDDPSIKALVEALESKETSDFIREHYKGAVIPVNN